MCHHFTPEELAAYCPGQTSQMRTTRNPGSLFFPFLSLLICLPALRCVSSNPLTLSSASFTNYNHLCTLTQPRMKMLCQLALWGWRLERGKGEANCEKQLGELLLFFTHFMGRWWRIPVVLHTVGNTSENCFDSHPVRSNAVKNNTVNIYINSKWQFQNVL